MLENKTSILEGVPVGIEGLAPGLLVVDEDGLPKANDPTVTISVKGNVATVQAVRQSDLRVFVDMSGLTVGEHRNVPVMVEPRGSSLRVTLTSDPAFLSFRLEQEITRTLPLTVEVTGIVPFSFEKGKPRLTQDERLVDSVQVRGPQSQVERISIARVVVDVDRLTANISSPQPIEMLSQDGQEIVGVMAEPAFVNVLVPISSSIMFKRVPVVPRIEGKPARGYIVTDIEVEPQTVILNGKSEPHDDIRNVKTVPLTLTGASQTFSQTIELEKLTGVHLLDKEPTSVTVTIYIAVNR